MTEPHRGCRCGALYLRTQAMAPAREINSFDCAVCGETMETWNSAWVPSYRLIVGPTIPSGSVPKSGTINSAQRFNRRKEEQ
jgi:hypothetical protein